jgi:hypothetical protein
MLPSNSLFRYQHSDSEENERSIALTCVSSWVSRSELTLTLLCCFITPRSLSLLTYTPFSTWWSQPSTTVPKTTCRPSRWEVLLVHCDPLGIFPRIRHANYSRSSVCFNWKFSSFKFCTVYRQPTSSIVVRKVPSLNHKSRNHAGKLNPVYANTSWFLWLPLPVTLPCYPSQRVSKFLTRLGDNIPPVHANMTIPPAGWFVNWHVKKIPSTWWWLLLWNNCVNVVGNVFTGHVAFRQVEDQEPHFLFHPLPL